jgi:hypothetical protein
MPGSPSKTFELEIAPLLPKQTQGVPGQQIAPGLKPFLESKRWEPLLNQTVVPLGLRWRVTPNMGLPRAPFSVWRRHRKFGDPIDVQFEGSQVNGFHIGNGAFHVPSAPLYVLLVTISNINPTQALNVQALDTANNPLPAQFVNLPANTSRTIRFQHPFIGGFACQGNFTIRGLFAVTMNAWIARKEEWELIEIVGLPAKQGEIGGYDAQLQGYPTQLKDPRDAAADRLNVAQQFYLPLATTLPSGVQVPVWEIPTPDEAIDELRGGAPSLLQRLDEMLRAVDTGAAGSQGDYRADVTMPGIRQPEFPSKITADATMNIPVLATVLLNAVTDSWFALASGFGSNDFPEFMPASERFLEPATYFHVSHDYMVSAPFIFRMFDTFEFKAEHCALSHRSVLPPIKPGGLAAAVYAQNRPPQRDNAWSAEVALTWAKINRLQIQGNAVAVAEHGLTGVYLNPLRPAPNAKKPALFVPAKPGETSDPDLQTKNRFFHHQAELPFANARTNHYGVASMDAFGRWSDWSTADQALAARLPEAPRLNGLALTPDKTRIAGNSAPHQLVVEVVWDWQDRSPKRFQLAAVFHRRRYLPDGTKDNGHIPPTDYPAIFQTDNTIAAGSLLDLTLPSDTPPGTPPVFGGLPTSPDPRVSVELLPQATNASGQNVEGEMRRYRVTMRDLNVAFQPDEEWYFTLFVKAAEWRNPALLSDSTPPLLPARPPRLTAYVPNPIPAPPPVFIPATVLWAALPDARGVSRYRLAFDPVPNATGGYAVFQAYEAKLRDMADLPVRDDTDLIGRATDLRDLAMPLERCLDAFTRLNTKLIPPPAPSAQVEYEVELPGALDGIVAFAVASVTREQEVSALSSPWLFVAVPRRVVPSMPLLSLAPHNGTATLTCTFPKAPPPARIQILRARREFAARDADTMGLPLHESLPAAWQPLDDQGTPAASAAEASQFRFFFDDPTPPAWFPYLYRAVAVGVRDDSNGFLPGRSPQSNLVQIERLPATLPEMLDTAGEQTNGQTVRLHFGSDALVDATPHGSFRLEVFGWDAAQQRFTEPPALSVLLPAASPRPASGNLATGTLYYGAPDANGRRTFEALFDVTGDTFLFKIRLTDPLNRSAERMVSGTITHDDGPNLADLRVRLEGRNLFVFFESTTSVAQPREGQFRLEIGFAQPSSRIVQLLLARALHEIGVGALAKLRTSPVTTILRAPQTSPAAANEYGAVIKNFGPASPFQPPRHGRLIVQLTAPDGTTARIEESI